MPLLIDGVQLAAKPESANAFLKQFPKFKESSAVLTSQAPLVVGPEGLLYVGQREYGGTSPDDSVIRVIGSEDATTCHIGVLRHTGSGAVCLLHFDGCNTQQGVGSMVQVVKELSQGKAPGRLELHLVGGFDDERHNSDEVSLEIFGCLVQWQDDIHLVTACIGKHNTTFKRNIPFPIIYGLAVEVQSGKIFSATFPDHGPDIPARSARHFTGSHDNLPVYDHHRKQMVIGPFTYRQLGNLDQILGMPDRFYRQRLSTSPAQEPASFEQSVRTCLQFMKEHPEPMKTFFPGGKPHYFKKEPDGRWTLL
ncbi:hypothetical protein BaRGS_00007408 [Batillaria attramentaria]|uniref:Protein N-terminal asparagine amidohydrolase n=1 Tax=Batillaria attramentaria TaxID=370345 RepID=A0ABD0LPX2_9CAEN